MVTGILLIAFICWPPSYLYSHWFLLYEVSQAARLLFKHKDKGIQGRSSSSYTVQGYRRSYVVNKSGDLRYSYCFM